MAAPKRSTVSERAFQSQVTNLATFYGWKWAHFHDSRRQVVRRGQTAVIGDAAAAGFPDLVLVRGPELLFVELKAEKGRTRPTQVEWIKALRVVEEAVQRTRQGDIWGTELAVEVHLWKPRDWDEVHDRLARGRVRQEPLYRGTGA
jgi:hypothetical protein